MAKHVLKVSSYIENEGFIYCPVKNVFVLVRISFPMTCPKCGENFVTQKDIKFVLRENLMDYGL